MKIDIDPIDFDSARPAPTAKKRWTIFLILVICGTVSGYFAVKKHLRELEMAVYKHPISTKVDTKGGGEILIDYQVEQIGNRVCLDIGHLRIVTPEGATEKYGGYYYGATSDTINLQDGHTSESSGYGQAPWELEIKNKNYTAELTFGHIEIKIDHQTARINEKTFPLNKDKTVIIIDHSRSISSSTPLQ